MTSTLEALREHLLTHSVRHGVFTMSSGRSATYYIDGKQTATRPDGILLVADAILDALPDEVTAIGGLTMGADPVAFATAAVAATRGRSLTPFSIRKQVKDHGAGGRIAGALQPGDKVAITEDASPGARPLWMQLRPCVPLAPIRLSSFLWWIVVAPARKWLPMQALPSGRSSRHRISAFPTRADFARSKRAAP